MSTTVNGTTGVTFPDGTNQNTSASGFGFKNRIINGAFMIDQRNAGAAVTGFGASAKYSLDRWAGWANGTGAFTLQQSSTAPAGFTKSLSLTVTTADSTVDGGDYYLIQQPIEGYNIADFNFGSAAASTITLSFWVRASVTGTFGGCVRNAAGNYSYPFQYTISFANTWEQKSVTISGATAGSWNTDNTLGLSVWFSVGVGTTYSDTAGAWTTKASVIGASGSTNLISTNGATFYITGVQLEKGSTATSFDYRPYGTELALCQRYYINYGTGLLYRLYMDSTYYTARRYIAGLISPFMRASPTATYTLASDGGYSGDVMSVVNNTNWTLYANSSGPGASIYVSALTFSAEL